MLTIDPSVSWVTANSGRLGGGDPTGELVGEPIPLLHMLFTSALEK